MELIGRLSEAEQTRYFKFVRVGDSLHITSPVEMDEYTSGTYPSHEELAIVDNILPLVTELKIMDRDEVDAGQASVRGSKSNVKLVMIGGESMTLRIMRPTNKAREKTRIIFQDHLPEGYNIELTS